MGSTIWSCLTHSLKWKKSPNKQSLNFLGSTSNTRTQINTHIFIPAVPFFQLATDWNFSSLDNITAENQSIWNRYALSCTSYVYKIAKQGNIMSQSDWQECTCLPVPLLHCLMYSIAYCCKLKAGIWRSEEQNLSANCNWLLTIIQKLLNKFKVHWGASKWFHWKCWNSCKSSICVDIALIIPSSEGGTKSWSMYYLVKSESSEGWNNLYWVTLNSWIHAHLL